MSILDLGLALAGMPTKTVDDLKAALPRIERIIAAYGQAAPDIAAVLPVIEELIAFVKAKESS